MTYDELREQFDIVFKKFEERFSKCKTIVEAGAEYNRFMLGKHGTLFNNAFCAAFENRVRELKETNA